MLASMIPRTWSCHLKRGTTTPRLWSAVLIVLLLGWSGSQAWASFDIVGVYHERVKGFEAVYYLEEDTRWHRDRRIFELFGNTDNVTTQGDDYDDTVSLGAASWGMLLNIRPDAASDAQLSFFSLQNRARFQFDVQLFEALHGARLTVSDYAEISLGSYWKEFHGEMSGSTFLEINSPRFFIKSSYVIGDPLGLQESEESLLELLRWDLRFPYDQWKFANLLEIGFTRYNFSGSPNLVAHLGIERLHAPKATWLGLNADADYSLTQSRLVQASIGIDLLIQPDADFNLTRRGHFGTSYGLSAMWRTGDPSALRVFSDAPSAPTFSLGEPRQNVTGHDITAHLQVPAKWVWTAIIVTASAAASVQADRDGDHRSAKRHRETGARVLNATLEEPRDILFCRMGFTYSHNDISSYDLIPELIPRERFLAHMSFVY
jgi:hypothetical protein